MRVGIEHDVVLAAVLERVAGPVAVVDVHRTVRVANAEFRARCPSEPVGRQCHDVLHGRSEPCPPDEVACPLRPSSRHSEAAPQHWHRVGGGVRRERVLMQPITRAGQVVACLARFWPVPRAAQPPGLRELELDIRPIRLELRRAALSQRPLLLIGEPGTHLATMAVAAHRLSRRRGAFEERAACELTRGRLGELLLSEPRQRLAATLHVQDVHELDRRGWAALAAWIGDGGPAPRQGWRLVASTERDVGALATDPVGASAAAVLARLRIRVPALRERRRDLPVIASRMLRVAAGRDLSLSPEAYACLERYSFPGNLDELEEAMQYAAVLAGGFQVRVEHLPAWLREGR
jgi:hypothetical protein